MIIVMTTCPAEQAAEALAEQIVDARLAACVQVLPQITSIYRWEGDVQKENEFLLLIKTLPEKWAELKEFITQRHSYDVPEIVAIPSSSVLATYLDWLRENTIENGSKS